MDDQPLDSPGVVPSEPEPGTADPSDRRWVIAGCVALGLAIAAVTGAVMSTDDQSVRGAEVSGSDGSVAFDRRVEPLSSDVNPSTDDDALLTPVDGLDRSDGSDDADAPVAGIETAPTAEPNDAPTTTAATPPPLDDDSVVVARPIPAGPPPTAPDAPPAPWAGSVVTTAGGHVSTEVGCAANLSASGLDEFFAGRVGPVIGWDYQHVYPLGGDRFLWLFQDTFIDHSNTASSLGAASFAHNTALVQEGRCFRLLHGGTPSRPVPFENGTGSATLTTWFWPMGGEVHDGQLFVFWARMVKDPSDPEPPDGLGWHPDGTFIGSYDPNTLARLDFRPARASGAAPIYGYAVASQANWTYLFGNTFEQNLERGGGWANGPHSGTKMYLARVPRGQLFAQPEYWMPGGWTGDGRAAVPILQRHWAEFPFQPRLIDGQWIASTAVNGYWGDSFELDVANNPWGPWTTVERRALQPRGADPKMNTYHAHLMPWRDVAGRAIVSVSNNARDMLRDAWPAPSRYRPNLLGFAWRTPPTDPIPTTHPPTTIGPTTSTTTAPRRTTTTELPATTNATGSTMPTSSSTTVTSSSTPSPQTSSTSPDPSPPPSSSTTP